MITKSPKHDNNSPKHDNKNRLRSHMPEGEKP
jgi:hypothetical protein